MSSVRPLRDLLSLIINKVTEQNFITTQAVIQQNLLIQCLRQTALKAEECTQDIMIEPWVDISTKRSSNGVLLEEECTYYKRKSMASVSEPLTLERGSFDFLFFSN